MTRYLKAPSEPSLEATDELRERVGGMLRDMEVGGIDAVRRWSAELDDWSPESFVVSDEESSARRRSWATTSRSTSRSRRRRSAASRRPSSTR